MRAPVLIPAAALALLTAASPVLAAPLTEDTIPPELVALRVPGAALGFADGPDLRAAVPPVRLSPAPDLGEDSLLLPEEGDDAEGGSAGLPSYQQELDGALHIDAGLGPAPDAVVPDGD